MWGGDACVALWWGEDAFVSLPGPFCLMAWEVRRKGGDACVALVLDCRAFHPVK